jgi:GT2 family glycosyltransferase/glycosyltransferase involved in cell wall biosynthesis
VSGNARARGDADRAGEPRDAPARPLNILILDFDFFTAIGGGQTFYRRVVERNPDCLFHYPSRGTDLALAGQLPPNARPFAFDDSIGFEEDVASITALNIPVARVDLAWQLTRVLAAVQGMSFHAVDVPSYFPVAHLVRPIAAGFGILVGSVALALLGWNTVSAHHGYAGDVPEAVVQALEIFEAESIAAADVRYVTSGIDIAQTRTPVPDVVEIDMHNVLEHVPLPEAEPPGEGLPTLWYVGRLDRAKAPDLFVELASRMPHLFGSCRLTGPDNPWSSAQRWSDRLAQAAAAHGLAVQYAGLLSDDELRHRVYRGRSVLVIPSRTDAFNLVALEALQNGCPILLSRRAGAFEFLSNRHPRLTPASMDPDDLEAAERELRSMLENYAAIARACRAAVRAHPLPPPRTGFMTEVYGAARSPALRLRQPTNEATIAFREREPLMRRQVRAFRVRRQHGDSPVASIIIPTFNRPAMLAVTLATLTRQSLAATEIIVVDDGSSDAKTVRNVARSFEPMVRLIRTPNRGEAAAVNCGLRAARGEFVGTLSDDDAYAPDLLETAVSVLSSNPGAICSYPDWDIVNESGQLVERHRLPDFDRSMMLTAHWCLPGPGAVVRRSIVERIGGRDGSFRYVSDFDMWLRAGALGDFVHIPRSQGIWRLHQKSATVSASRRRMAHERIRLLQKFYSDPAEQARHGGIRATAFAAAHLAAAAILGPTEARHAMVHLSCAAALDPVLPHSLPPNMTGYPQAWPPDAERAFAVGENARGILGGVLLGAGADETQVAARYLSLKLGYYGFPLVRDMRERRLRTRLARLTRIARGDENVPS